MQHLRVPKANDKQLPELLASHAQKTTQLGTEHTLLRHIVAGEIYEGSEAKLEVILIGAAHEVLLRHLDLIERSHIDIETINVEPCALLNAFAAVLDQPDEPDDAIMFVDLGHLVTKVVVAHGKQVAFCRTLDVAAAQLCSARSAGANLTARASADDRSPRAARASLCEDIRSCVRYHEAIFEFHPIRKVIFLGGLSNDTQLCRELAQGVGLPAQLGDPLARVSEQSKYGPHSDLKPDHNHSDWAIAFGLSLAGLQGKTKIDATVKGVK